MNKKSKAQAMDHPIETNKNLHGNSNSVAVVFGASGGIGAALTRTLQANKSYGHVIPLSRKSNPPIDLLNEDSLEHAIHYAAGLGQLRLLIDATGFLHDENQSPEKNLRQLKADQLARSYALNAIGPALLMKHALPLMPRTGKAVFATLSARVGSIGDNRLGGWYAYRAAKAALNQLVRTASIELGRRSKDAICVALHPGTVSTSLSSPFSAQGLNVHTPDQAALHLLSVIEALESSANGNFYDWRGQPIPW